MRLKLLVFGVIGAGLLLLPGKIFAQNGWDDIRKNDNKLARTHFEETLSKDSINRDALQGMIYLSEVEGDNLNYRKYVTTLIDNYWLEQDYLLYNDVYRLKSEKTLLAKNSISEKTKFSYKMAAAYELMRKGQKDQAIKEYRKLTHDFNWSVIGPFKNISGSGHIKEFPVETASYDNSAVYPDEDGLPVHWQECKARNPNGFISFDNNLPESRSGVYYMNTFISVPKTQLVQFRIARASPLKIWLDDDLVFNSSKNSSWSYDNENIELQLPAGNHKLMMKTSYLYEEGKVANYDDYDGDYDRGFSAPLFAKGYKPVYDYKSLALLSNRFSKSSNNPLIRITDTAGNLIQDISSSFKADYQKRHYDVKLNDMQMMKYYLALINKNPNDLYPYYALSMSYINADMGLEGEEFFVKAQRKSPSVVFYKYVASKIYAQNGKMEKFYEVLNGIDQQKTPVYTLLYEKFKEKDRKTDEDEWLAALKTIYAVSPSNYGLILAYLKYYDDKGMKKEKEDFAKEVSEKYPVYKDRIDSYLKDNNGDEGDEDSYSGSRGGNWDMGEFFSDNDYSKLRRLKKHGSIKKVCRIYDKMQADQPYNIDFIYEKADYLKDKKKYDAAVDEVKKALALNEYNEKLYELLGDIYKEKEMKDSAVFYYKKAKYYSASSYKAEEIDDKMEKVQEQKSLKKLFDTKKFEDILSDNGWQAKYTDEESVVLMFTRDLVLDEFNHAQLFSKIMIKILKDPGVIKWTEYNFSFLGRVKAAKVIKQNGAEVIPDIQGGYAVFKDLMPGDIIQIEGMYKWSPVSELDNELTLNNFFTFDAPVYYTKFEVAVQKGKYLNYLNHKMADNLVKSTKNGYDFYRWEYHDTHKMEHEDASLDDYDQFGTIMISTMKDWSKVVEWYGDKTYKKLDATYEVKEILDSIITPGMTPQDKVRAIYNYLTKDIKYSYVSFMQSGQIPKRCGLTLSSKIGDCKDVATVMVSMLRQVGIEAYYTLVKTNYYDHFKYLPSMYFDHVIAGYYLDGKLHFADMTTDYYPHYVLTDADANAYALLIKNGTTELIQLPQDDLDPNKNNVEMKIDATLLSDRSIKLKVNANHPGLAGGLIREKFARMTQDQQKNLILDMMGKGVFQNIELKDYHYDNITEITAPLKSDYELEAGAYCDKVAGLLIFRVPYMTAIQQSQAMLSKTRYNRLNVKALSSTAPTTQKIDLHFPAGWQLIEIPENVMISGKYGEFKIKYTRIKDGIHIEKYQQFNEDEVPVEEYDNFKAYYFQVLEADATRMALQKKKPVNN